MIDRSFAAIRSLPVRFSVLSTVGAEESPEMKQGFRDPNLREAVRLNRGKLIGAALSRPDSPAHAGP
jgi:hypothetical protein